MTIIDQVIATIIGQFLIGAGVFLIVQGIDMFIVAWGFLK